MSMFHSFKMVKPINQVKRGDRMNKYDVDFTNVSIGELIEKEDDLTCDIDLYKEQILDLQLAFQRKDIDYKKYMNDYQNIYEHMQKLIDYKSNISHIINQRIKYSDDDDTMELKNNDFIEFYYHDEYYGGF